MTSVTTNIKQTTTQPLLRPYTNNNINSDLVAPKYKSRYEVEETIVDSNNNVKNGWFTKSFSPRCIISTLCCHCFNLRNKGMSRRKTLLVVVGISIVCILVNFELIRPMTRSYEKFHNFSLAKKESYGLFDDISHSNWKSMQTHVYDQRKKQGGKPRGIVGKIGHVVINLMKPQDKSNIVDPSHYSDVSQFYQNHWHAEFTCPHEERIGYSDIRSKYLCNPRRIGPASQIRQKKTNNGCIIYTSTADVNQFSFEKALLDLMRNVDNRIDCEIHVFSPNKNFEEETIPEGVHFHEWGFSGSKVENKDNEAAQFKTISDTLHSLGHCGEIIDILSIDCEGCEFDIYNDLFSDQITDSCARASFLQILIQVHGAPSVATNDFFFSFQKNDYVIFHKEGISQSNGNGQDYGFLKLSNEFFI